MRAAAALAFPWENWKDFFSKKVYDGRLDKKEESSLTFFAHSGLVVVVVCGVKCFQEQVFAFRINRD